MTDIIAQLKEPEAHHPGNFDTPKRANAMLSCLCQEAMEEIEYLRRELENERARDIHSCGPDCTRSGCVNRRLREELAEARQEIADRKTDCETGHDQDEATIAELRQQLKHITDQYLAALDAEQVRYRQVVEKDAEIERLSDEIGYQSQWKTEFRQQKEYAEKQLAASQAREQQLRDVLRDCYVEFFYVNQQLNAVRDEDGEPLYTEGKTVTSALAKGKETLTLPQDTTAIEAMIAKAGEMMRERCELVTDRVPIRVGNNGIWGVEVFKEIRSLPAVTIDDLK